MRRRSFLAALTALLALPVNAGVVLLTAGHRGSAPVVADLLLLESGDQLLLESGDSLELE
ncbi:MAG: hypothetical protein ABI640_12900 [Gammaproteobacteria bacterium]